MSRNGYILFEFLNFEQESQKMDWEARKTFVMGIKSVDIILGLNIFAPFDKNMDQDGEIAFYKPPDENATRVLKVTKQENREFLFTYCDINDDEQLEVTHEITLKPGQVRAMQVLIEYAMPSLLGWQTLNNHEAVGDWKY